MALAGIRGRAGIARNMARKDRAAARANVGRIMRFAKRQRPGGAGK